MYPELPDQDGLTTSLTERSFWVNNPYDQPVYVELDVLLPSFLKRKKWKIDFRNAGGYRFQLPPRG